MKGYKSSIKVYVTCTCWGMYLDDHHCRECKTFLGYLANKLNKLPQVYLWQLCLVPRVGQLYVTWASCASRGPVVRHVGQLFS